jgi:hypothetical protein
MRDRGDGHRRQGEGCLVSTTSLFHLELEIELALVLPSKNCAFCWLGKYTTFINQGALSKTLSNIKT